MSRIPCRKTLGHGESCCDGYLCDSCREILNLRRRISNLERAAAEVVVVFNRTTDPLDSVVNKLQTVLEDVHG